MAEAEVGHRPGNVDLARQVHRLAVVQRFGLGEALQVPLDQFGETASPGCAFASGAPPSQKAHGGVDRACTSAASESGRRACTVPVGMRPARHRPAGLQPAVDQVQDAFHGRPRRYPVRSSHRGS